MGLWKYPPAKKTGKQKRALFWSALPFLMTLPSQAAVDSDNVSIHVAIGSQVQIVLTDPSLAFGAINPVSGSGNAATTAAGLVLTNTPVTISLPAQATLNSGGNHLPVNLAATYTNADGTTAFTNNSGTLTAATVTPNPETQIVGFDVTGSFAYGNSTPPGAYTGSVVITATTP